uniref:Bro-N domain-containing protein n=1 Tax=Pyramimonas orientalis virus TaxID=455367 RepID=A0A7M3UP70_POV01|nr:hypothetical protein HWQ62_00406 [Pyramimonas orientalis virus]
MDNVKTYVSNNNRTYYLLEDIKEQKLNVDYFTGCKSMKKCIQRQKIPADKIIYMKNNKEYDADYKLASVYVEEQYAKDNIMNKDAFKKKKEKEKNDKKKAKDDKTRKNKEQVIEKKTTRKQYNDVDIEDEPPIVHLEDNEMFQNEKGEPMDITVRGEKTQKGAYFNAYDIGKAFEYTNINRNVLHINGDYVYGIHYIYFYSVNKKKCLYLTYKGLLKLLFCSRGDRGVLMQNMITKTMFTTTFGSQDSKDELAAEMLKVDKAVITEVFRKSCGRVSCVYLFKVGRVGDMRNHFNLDGFNDDDAFIYKYGQTNNLVRRTSDHTKSYGQLENNSFDLSLFSYIDVVYVSDAEACIREYANKNNLRVKDKKYNELIVLQKHEFSEINTLYQEIYNNFSGKNSVVVQQLQDIQNNIKVEQLQHTKHIQDLEKKLELQERDMQLKIKDLELMYLRKINDLYVNNKRLVCK